MNTIARGVLLVVAVLGSGLLLTACTKARTQTISAATIAALPSGTTFDVDLTRKGTVYRFQDGSTNFSRVAVRTAAGTSNFAELLKKADTRTGRGLILGRPDDMRDHLPTGGGVATKYDCGVICKCDNLNDCIDLIADGKCLGDFWCSSETSACFCTAKP